MIWFTSDTHFAHANIIKYCQRPFMNVDEMNFTMVQRWNRRVGWGDTVYHLGDFAFGPAENVTKYRTLLNGKIILIKGNHDRSVVRMEQLGFDGVAHRAEFKLGRRSLLLTHKPELLGAVGFDYHLHGHVHEKYARQGNSINVGVDVRGFEPKTLEELLA